jgi:putative PIG3 family NAD(P)H quinone oxidoreductase
VTVRALRIAGAGGPEVLVLGETSVPAPGPREVRVRVEAAGVNRADLLQRRGLYPAPPGAPPDIPGLEYAGVVIERGDGALRHVVGARVMGIVAGGAMAEELVVHEDEAIPVPDGLALVEAAAIPEVFITAWDAMFRQAAVGSGSVVLIHAAASGVGTAAVQLARRAGAIPIGTGRSAAKLAQVTQLEAALVVEREPPSFAEEVRARSGGRGADVILDGVGGAYLGENVRALALRGTLVVIGLLGGARAELALGELLTKRATVRGTVLRSRSRQEKIELARAFEAEVLPGLVHGELRPQVERVMPMQQAPAAHALLEANAVVGKIVLRW